MKRRLFWLMLLCFAVLLAFSLMVEGEEQPAAAPAPAMRLVLPAPCTPPGPNVPEAISEPFVALPFDASALCQPEPPPEDPAMRSMQRYMQMCYQAFHYSDEAG